MTSPFTVSAQVCDEPDPIDWLPDPHGVLAWLRGDEGFVGWGTAASFRPIGRERFGEPQRWWIGFLQSTVPDDATSVAPDGPIGFVRMAYADESDQSLVTVPEVLARPAERRAADYQSHLRHASTGDVGQSTSGLGADRPPLQRGQRVTL